MFLCLCSWLSSKYEFSESYCGENISYNALSGLHWLMSQLGPFSAVCCTHQKLALNSYFLDMPTSTTTRSTSTTLLTLTSTKVSELRIANTYQTKQLTCLKKADLPVFRYYNVSERTRLSQGSNRGLTLYIPWCLRNFFLRYFSDKSISRWSVFRPNHILNQSWVMSRSTCKLVRSMFLDSSYCSGVNVTR